MKNHITPKQAQQITETEFYQLFDEIVPRDDWANFHHKKMTVAKMIDVLDNVSMRKNATGNSWKVQHNGKTHHQKDLVDALWLAVRSFVRKPTGEKEIEEMDISKYAVSEEEMVRLGAELGLKVSFNSDNPGILNTTTGERIQFEDVFPELKALDEKTEKGESDENNEN